MEIRYANQIAYLVKAGVGICTSRLMYETALVIPIPCSVLFSGVTITRALAIGVALLLYK